VCRQRFHREYLPESAHDVGFTPCAQEEGIARKILRSKVNACTFWLANGVENRFNRETETERRDCIYFLPIGHQGDS
jgi:hypothetical protein